VRTDQGQRVERKGPMAEEADGGGEVLCNILEVGIGSWRIMLALCKMQCPIDIPRWRKFSPSTLRSLYRVICPDLLSGDFGWRVG
jgi:hypothetical protein